MQQEIWLKPAAVLQMKPTYVRPFLNWNLPDHIDSINTYLKETFLGEMEASQATCGPSRWICDMAWP
jgi:hypothetical protein